METMKTVKAGLIRYIDDLGRVVIPKELRKAADITDGDPLEMWVDPDGNICIKKYTPEPRDLVQEVTHLQNYIHESENDDSDKSRWIKSLEKIRREMSLAKHYNGNGIKWTKKLEEVRQVMQLTNHTKHDNEEQ